VLKVYDWDSECGILPTICYFATVYIGEYSKVSLFELTVCETKPCSVFLAYESGQLHEFTGIFILNGEN
jgi:hypothetical protein